MLNEAYAQGQRDALTELQKTAGDEFIEKVAGKMDGLKNFGNKVHGAFGKAKDSVKSGYGKAKEGGSKAVGKVKDYHRGMGSNLKHSFKKETGDGAKSRMHHAGQALKKAAPAAGIAGLTAGGGFAATKD